MQRLQGLFILIKELYKIPVKKLNFINNLISVLNASKLEERTRIKRKVNKTQTVKRKRNELTD